MVLVVKLRAKSVNIVKEEAINRGYVFLGADYVGAHVKYEYQCCKCKHIRFSAHHEILKSVSCRNCKKIFFSTLKLSKQQEKKKENFRKRKEYVRYEVIEDYGLSLLVSCWKYHRFIIDLTKPLATQKCSECKILNVKKTVEYVDSVLSKDGYTRVGDYKNTQVPFEVCCDKGHMYKTNINDFKRGYRCKQCLVKTEESIAKEITSLGFRLIGDYRGYHNYYTFKCLVCGLEFKASYDNIKKGSSCKFCYASSLEKKVLDLLNKLGVVFETHNRTLLKGNVGFVELDFVIGDLNLAIEVCGNYYHSMHVKEKYYHLHKMLACRKLGYDLITIFEHDFLMAGWDIILGKLLNKEPVLVESPFGYNFGWTTKKTEEYFNLKANTITPPKLVTGLGGKILYDTITSKTVWDCGHILKDG